MPENFNYFTNDGGLVKDKLLERAIEENSMQDDSDYVEDPSKSISENELEGLVQLSQLKSIIDGVNTKFNTTRPVYTQYVKFDVAGVTLADTMSLEWSKNNLVSLINEQNGSGSANKFTLELILKPNERNVQSILEIELILNLACQICLIRENNEIDYTQLKERENIFQNCTFQYGYGDDPDLRSPVYSGMILDYTSSISNGTLKYTITGVAGVDAMSEVRISTKEEYLKDSEGNEIDNPISFVKRICEVEFQSDDSIYDNLYNVKILDNVNMSKVVATNDSYKQINDKNIFQAITDILACAIDEDEYEKLNKSLTPMLNELEEQNVAQLDKNQNLSYDEQGMTIVGEQWINDSRSQKLMVQLMSKINLSNEQNKIYEKAKSDGIYNHKTISIFDKNVDVQMIGNRMIVGTLSTYDFNDKRTTGSYLDVYWSNGEVWHCIKGNNLDSVTPSGRLGLEKPENKLGILQLLANSNIDGVPNCGNNRIEKIVNLGNYIDNPDYATRNSKIITNSQSTFESKETENDTSIRYKNNTNTYANTNAKAITLNNDIQLMDAKTKGTSGFLSNPFINGYNYFNNNGELVKDKILEQTIENNKEQNKENNNTGENNSSETNDSNSVELTTYTSENDNEPNMVPTQKNIFGYYVSNAITEDSGLLGTIYIYRMKPRSEEDDVNDLTNINIDFAWFGHSDNIYNHLVKEWTPKYEGKVLMSLAANINRNGINKKYPTLDSDGNLIEVQGLGAVRMGLQSSGTNSVDDIIHNIAQEYTQWAYLTQYEYQASMTTLGIPCEFPLTRYIKVSPKIYDQEHLSAGIYMMKGKKDIINSSGFFTSWDLLKYVKNFNPDGYENDDLEPSSNVETNVDVSKTI